MFTWGKFHIKRNTLLWFGPLTRRRRAAGVETAKVWEQAPEWNLLRMQPSYGLCKLARARALHFQLNGTANNIGGLLSRVCAFDSDEFIHNDGLDSYGAFHELKALYRNHHSFTPPSY